MSTKDNKPVEKEEEETSDQKAGADETNDESVDDDKEEETSDQDADADEANDDDQSDEDDRDYKAELSRAEEERDNYKKGMINAKDELKEEKKKKSVDPDEIKKLVEEGVKAETTAIREEFAAERIESALQSLTDNPDKQKLILFHYNNSINKTGYTRSQIVSDMEKALAIVDSPKVKKENKNLKDSIRQKETTSANGMGNNQDRPDPIKKKNRKFSERELALLKRRGIDPDKVVSQE